MLNKYFLFIAFLIFLGCSKENDVDLSNSVNVFETKTNISYVKTQEEKNNSQLSEVKDIREILNSKSYKLNNSSIKYPFKKVWQVDTDQNIDDQNPYLPEPLFFGSNIYLLNNRGYLFKINSENGKIIWKKLIFEDIENTIIGTPAISGIKNKNNNATLFAHNGSRKLVAINGDDGSIVWEKKMGLPFRGGITSFKNYIFASDFDGNFFSINNKTGETLWNVFLGSEYSSVYTTARPIVAKNKIIVPATRGTFFVVSVDTGEVLWSENILSNKQLPKLFHKGDIVANPLNYEGIVYVVSQSGLTAAFDIDTSEKLWNIPIGGFETPVISGKTIFIIGNFGLLAAIDKNSGKLRWQKNYNSYLNKDSFFGDKEIAIYKGPSLVDSKILISNQKGLVRIIDANNGSEISTLKVGELAFPAIPIYKKILFLTANGKLMAYK